MQISAASLLKVWLLFNHLLCNKPNTAEEIHNKEFIKGTSQTVISHEKKNKCDHTCIGKFVLKISISAEAKNLFGECMVFVQVTSCKGQGEKATCSL